MKHLLICLATLMILSNAAAQQGTNTLESSGSRPSGNTAGVEKKKAPAINEPWQSVPAELLINSTSSMKVSITPAENRKVFRGGEKMRFKVKTSEPGYLYVIVFSQKNRASVIFPNKKDSDNKVAAATITIPRTSRYSFPVGEPFGKDLVVALVSSRPLKFGDDVWHRWKEIFDAVPDPQLRASVNRIYADQSILTTRGISVDDDEIQDAKKRGIDVWYEPGEKIDWQGATLPIESKEH